MIVVGCELSSGAERDDSSRQTEHMFLTAANLTGRQLQGRIASWSATDRQRRREMRAQHWGIPSDLHFRCLRMSFVIKEDKGDQGDASIGLIA